MTQPTKQTFDFLHFLLLSLLFFVILHIGGYLGYILYQDIDSSAQLWVNHHSNYGAFTLLVASSVALIIKLRTSSRGIKH